MQSQKIRIRLKAYETGCGKCPQLNSSKQRDISYWLHRHKKKIYSKAALMVICPSRWLAEAARKSSLLCDAHIEVIYNGVDVSRFRPQNRNNARRELGLEVDSKLILYGAVGAFTDSNKGSDLLVSALKIYQHAGKRVDIAIFGTEQAPDALSASINGRTHVLGFINDIDKLATLYSAADVMIVPSRSESLGFTVMEAMSCVTPVVAFRVGGIPELVTHKVTGYLATPYNCNELAEGIEWALNLEGAEAAEVSCQARSSIEVQFTLEQQVDKYCELYNHLILDYI